MSHKEDFPTISDKEKYHYQIFGYLILKEQKLPTTPEATATQLMPLAESLYPEKPLSHCQRIIECNQDAGWHNQEEKGIGCSFYLLSGNVSHKSHILSIIPGSHYAASSSTYSQKLADTLHGKKHPLGMPAENIPGHKIFIGPNDILVLSNFCERLIANKNTAEKLLEFSFFYPSAIHQES